MDKKQENQLTMFYAVEKTLERHTAVWSGVPAMATATTEYGANIASLEACVEKQVIDIRGFARAKAEAEAAMAALTLQVAGGVRAYATVVGDSVLADKMNVTRSALVRHRDSVVAQHCQGIHTEATAVVGSLADYGVLPATLTALQEAIDAYVAAITAPRNAITQRKGATAELRMLLKDTTKLLVKRLDSLVEQFRMSQPVFYRDYHNSRMIVDLGTGSAEGTGEPVPVAA